MTEKKKVDAGASDADIHKQLNAWRWRGAELHVAMRSISGYTGDDLMLGFFRRENEAKAALKRYREYVETRGDPWKEQGYCTPDLDTDLRVYPIDLVWEGKLDKHIYVMFTEGSGFGQGYSNPVAAFANEVQARAALEEQCEHDATYKGYFPPYHALKVFEHSQVHYVGEVHHVFEISDDRKMLLVGSDSYWIDEIDGQLCLHLDDVIRHHNEDKKKAGHCTAASTGLPFCGGRDYELVGAKYVTLGTKCEVRYIGEEPLHEELLERLTQLGITVMEDKPAEV